MEKSTLILMAFAILFLASCAAPTGVTIKEYGFWWGLWHGLILPFVVVGKIFSADIDLYARHNSGIGYWIGYLIGIGGLGFSASRSNK